MTEETEKDETVETLDDIGLTGKEVEDFMIKAAQERAEDPMEMAAGAYTMYAPYYRAAVPKLSKRSLRRILDYLIFYPFQQDTLKVANEAEKSVMQLANMLIEAKFIMQMAQYSTGIEQIVEAVESELTEEQKQEIAKELGVENG